MKLFILAIIAGSAFATPALRTRQASCDAQKVAQLAGGIQANLYVQKQELEGIKDLQKLETNNATAASFATKRQDVLVIQQLGINIRTQNQQIAGEIKSPAIAGLNTVQGAQTTEMRQVMGLTGNEKTDAAVLQTLVKEVEDGTKQNEANLAAAQGQCKK